MQRHILQSETTESVVSTCSVLSVRAHATIMNVAVTWTPMLAFLVICLVTTSDAWLFTNEKKPIEEYEFADCKGKRYWTYDSICCKRTVHYRIFRDDECCGGYRYNRRYDICCDDHPFLKENIKKCQEKFDDGVKLNRISH